MHIYYLEKPLSQRDLAIVTEELGLTEAPVQVAIPYVLPTFGQDLDYMALCARHERVLRGHLRRAGISSDRDSQVAFVAPRDMHWYAALVGAFAAETGHYPYVIQTRAQRKAIGNPGDTRVLDGHGLMGFKR